MPFKTERVRNQPIQLRTQERLQPAGSTVRWKLMPRSGQLMMAVLLMLCFAAPCIAGEQILWNFNHTIANSLGGEYNAFSRQPSQARTYLDPDVHLSNSGYSLRITVHRRWQGFCGVWFNFYPAASHRTFDARTHPYLSFWVRGQRPGGDFDVKIVDARGEKHEDSLETRPVHAYLPGGITTQWQQVVIPLADFPEVEPGSLVRMVFIFSTPGDYRFYVDNIAFQSSAGSTPATVAASAVQKSASPSAAIPFRSTWVWKTTDLLSSPKAANRLFNFCARNGLKGIYLSVNFAGAPGSVPHTLATPAVYGDFLSAAHLRGIRVDALTGDPSWAAGRYHQKALGAVRAIVRYNAKVTPDARFDGIHFDVEPYLLLGFSMPFYQKRLLKDYLRMVASCAQAARKGGVTFTCDVPWWFYDLAPGTQPQFTVNFQGKDESVGRHVTDLLNCVTIMDYRNEADGAGGIIRFGIPALAYAASVHKRVRIGLETSAQRDLPVEFVLAIPEKDFPARLQKTHLADSSTFEDYSVHALRGRGMVFVGLGLQGSDAAGQTSLAMALLHLRRLFGAGNRDRFSIQGALAEARAAIAAKSGWNSFEPHEIHVPGSRQTITAFRAVRGMPPVTTFHGLSRAVFEQESRSAAEWLGRYPSFDGLAIHYYQTFRALMEKTAPSAPAQPGESTSPRGQVKSTD